MRESIIKRGVEKNNKVGTILRTTLLYFIAIILILFLSLTISVQAASITTNVSETNINSTIQLNGTGFAADTTYYLIPLLENKSAWWDSYAENWFFDNTSTNTTINVTTNSSGEFTYNLYIPNDWRVAGGKVTFKIGESVASSLLWSTQGRNWVATQPTKNGVTGDSDPNGFIYTASNVGVANQGGIEKFYKSNGSSPCNYSYTSASNINDITTNGSVVYGVTSGGAILRVNASNCALQGSTATVAIVAYSVNVAPDNSYIIITYASGTVPRKYMIRADPPTQNATFVAPAMASIAYDSCISPDGTTVYIGYANGNVTALDSGTGALIWNSDPPETELGNAGYAFPVNGLSCDNTRVYLARGSVNYPTGIIEQGFVEALWATNGSRAWINSKTDTIYDGMDVSNIKCDSDYCYAVKATTPAPYTGVVGSAIVQINKTNGNVTWLNWRSWLPTTYNGPYGTGTTHSAAQTLWVDSNITGYLYPIYTNGWVQKIAKADVNVSTYDANIWIRGLTNFWNYVSDVEKNIWLSNETPYFNFKHWNQQGVALNTSNPNLVGTFFRYSMLNTFNSFTAYEYSVTNILGNSLFIDPVIQTAVTQRNAVKFYWDTAPAATCTLAQYGYVNLRGWYYEDRNCQYSEVPANATGNNIGTTINGTFITGIVYSLIKTKFWENYSITKYYGDDNWAWTSRYNGSTGQQLGFTTKFGNDQEDVYSDIYGRSVLFTNYNTTYYYRPQFRADTNRKTDTYILFKSQGAVINGSSYIWGDVDLETQKIASPITINFSTDEIGSYNIGIYSYAHRINFTAQEPDLMNRTDEPVEIIFNASGGIRSDCQDVVITDNTDTPIDIWQVDNSATCLIGDNISVWIMMNWTKNEIKDLRLYYNGSSSTPTPLGTTDLTITTASGACGTNNHEINVVSSNWYNWTRPAAATAANEQTRYLLGNDNTTNMWASTTHYQITRCYKNSNTTGTGVGAAADTCGTVAVPVSRCLVAGGTGKIFAKLNATVAMTAIANRNVSVDTMYVEYYFFANTGRVRIRTQLNQSLPILHTTVSKNWPPYYYFSINGLIPPSGTNSWLYYSGLYEQMKKPIATFNPDQTEVNLSVSPLPLMFTIKYGDFENIPQANGSLLRPSTLGTDFWDKGCTAHKIWEYYSYTGGATYGTATAPLYTSEFISCDSSLASQLPTLGQPGYVNVIPEMAWDGTTVNKWYDPTLIGKFYMMPNTYRPYNRENRFLAPYATPTGAAGASTPYSTSARISSVIVPVCPEEQYGYKGYDDFLEDVPNLIANTAIHIRNNTQNIPCAAQIIKFTDQRGSDGIHILFAKNLTVIVGQIRSAGWTYPFNTFTPGAYTYQADGDLDMTFAQSSSFTAGYYGKYYFTYTPYNYIMDTFSTSGNPQFTLTGTPSTPTAATLTMYTTRYSFAPEAYYNKIVFDESALWQKESQNFTYYRNPCWLGRYDNIYGSTSAGHPSLATLSTPGWQTDLWGSANNAYSTTCARTEYNMELQDLFRPARGNRVPTATDAIMWNELFIDGRENFDSNGTPPGAQDTYYVARHNALLDDKHNDDFNTILNDYSDLNQGTKHPNAQPWYCQISRHSNKSFCVMTSSLSSLIYNYNPGAGLTASQGWSPYWSSMREASTFRNYYVSRYGDTSGWLMPYDYILDVTMYPTLQASEVMTSNLLYTTANADDYQTFFRNQFPTAQKSIAQNQFLLKDWKNAAFIYFDKDSREYSSGLPLTLAGIALQNGSILIDKNITLEIYDSTDTLITEINTTTNSSGMFNWSTILPANLTAGLNYVQFNYNNEIIDKASFRTINLIATILNNKAVYEQGESVNTTITVANSYTGLVEDVDQLELRYINTNNQIFECAKYPSTAVVSDCDNNLTRIGVGTFEYNISLSNNPLGIYVQKATITQDGISADYTKRFTIALIDPCAPNSNYAYALNYPMDYDNTTDTLTIIGNSTFGNISNATTFEHMYEFAQATKGTCIIDKPSVGAYSVKSRLIIGNGIEEIYVSSPGETISFSSEAMPQLFINENAHMNFGTIIDDIAQQGVNIKFLANQTNDIVLDVAGGELAFYDSYIGDAGEYFGRFMYRGTCGILPEEISNTNSSIKIIKTIFDKASAGQYFFTNNATIEDIKINRINPSSSEGYGLVSGCDLPVLNTIQIYHQEGDGSAIFISNNTPANTSLIIQNSILKNNTKDIIAGPDGRGVMLINTIWDRTFGFNWTDVWTGTTTIQETSVHILNFKDAQSNPLENASTTTLNVFGGISSLTSDYNGEVPLHYHPIWQVEKTIVGEEITEFNPYTIINKKYGKFVSIESKSFAGEIVETTQLEDNPFVYLPESQAAILSNIIYNEPTKVSYGDEYNDTWTTGAEQLSNYPIDSCQYYAIFANKTKLIEGVDYTLSYSTGTITFLTSVEGYTVYPVYYYGGNITLTNGVVLSDALTMGEVYDHMQYLTSKNNLSEDLTTIDGTTYNFCVNLVLGNETVGGGISDNSKIITFNDGYELSIGPNGGLFDLAGIGGTGTVGAIELSKQIVYPGDSQTVFVSMSDSLGSPLTGLSIYARVLYPNGTECVPKTLLEEIGNGLYKYTFTSDPTVHFAYGAYAFHITTKGISQIRTFEYIPLEDVSVKGSWAAQKEHLSWLDAKVWMGGQYVEIDGRVVNNRDYNKTLTSSDLYIKDMFIPMPSELTVVKDTWYIAAQNPDLTVMIDDFVDGNISAWSISGNYSNFTGICGVYNKCVMGIFANFSNGGSIIISRNFSSLNETYDLDYEEGILDIPLKLPEYPESIIDRIIVKHKTDDNNYFIENGTLSEHRANSEGWNPFQPFYQSEITSIVGNPDSSNITGIEIEFVGVEDYTGEFELDIAYLESSKYSFYPYSSIGTKSKGTYYNLFWWDEGEIYYLEPNEERRFFVGIESPIYLEALQWNTLYSTDVYVQEKIQEIFNAKFYLEQLQAQNRIIAYIDGLGGANILESVEIAVPNLHVGHFQTVYVGLTNTLGLPATGQIVTADLYYPNGTVLLTNMSFEEYIPGFYKLVFIMPPTNTPIVYGSYSLRVSGGFTAVRTFNLVPNTVIDITGPHAASGTYFSWFEAKVWDTGTWIEAEGNIINNLDEKITLTESDMYNQNMFVLMPREFSTTYNSWYVSELYPDIPGKVIEIDLFESNDFSNWTISGNVTNVTQDCEVWTGKKGCAMYLNLNFTEGGYAAINRNFSPIDMTYDFWSQEVNLAINVYLPEDISTIDTIVTKIGTDENNYYIENKTLRYWKISRGGWQILEPYYNSEYSVAVGNPDPANLTYIEITITPVVDYNNTMDISLADLEYRRYDTLSFNALGKKGSGNANYVFWMDNMTSRTYTLAPNERRNFYVGLESPIYSFAYQLAAQFPTDEYIQERVTEIYDAQFYWEQLSAWDRLNAYINGNPGQNLFVITTSPTTYERSDTVHMDIIVFDRLGNLLSANMAVNISYPNGTEFNYSEPIEDSVGRYHYTFEIPSDAPYGDYDIHVVASLAGYISTNIKTFRVISSTTNSGSAYPTIELSASSPIATVSTASIGALVKSSTGEIIDCDGDLGITIRDLATGISTNDTMNNFSTGMYNYSWTTPMTPGVFYVNTSCSISGTSYTGFTLLSTQPLGATASIDYATIATYVWNYTSRNLTYYNQSASESIQSCLKDGECSSWWLNTTFTNIENTINLINSTSNNIKNTADIMLTYFNCTESNEVCTRLQNILSNTTDIQARVNSLNTTQIPALQTSVNNIYSDTQFIRTNMATLSNLQNMNATLVSMSSIIANISQNMLNQSIFDNNMLELILRLDEISNTTNNIAEDVDCSIPANSELCTYLDDTDINVNDILTNMATSTQINNLNSNISSITQNMLNQSTFNLSIANLISRMTEINTTTQIINTRIDCSIPTNSELCTYLDNINSSSNMIYSSMATYSQLQNISNNTEWLRNNVATGEALENNFSQIMNKLNLMNNTLNEIINNTNNITNSNELLFNLSQNISQQCNIIQNNITWLINNVATSEQIENNFTETLTILNNINSSLTNTQNYLYNNITEVLLNINSTTYNSTNYLYTNFVDMISELNFTTNNTYAYLVNNLSLQLSQLNISGASGNISTNLTPILDEIYNLQQNLTFITNNMFYQGNATGSFLVDYAATPYIQNNNNINNRAELWIQTRDLLGNSKTVVSADCNISQRGITIANANVNISPGNVYAYWDIPSSQNSGEYYWDCVLTGSIINLNVPFFVAQQEIDFDISALVSGSPRYPNEDVLVEVMFSGLNGSSIEPDTINLTIYDTNNNVWANASKSSFTKNLANIWQYSKSIEANPTTGMYTINLYATYQGITESKATQFRIATGGPYKVYIDCPSSTYTGQDLGCTVIIQDEGEAATESITTVWVDINNNGINDTGEPRMSFSKRTEPFQTVTQPITLNIPSNHPLGLFMIQAETEYVGSVQPNSKASDSVLFSLTTPSTGTGTTGGGGSSGVSTTTIPQVPQNPIINGSTNIDSSKSNNNLNLTNAQVYLSGDIVCNNPYIRKGAECCLDLNSNAICDYDERTPSQYPNPKDNIISLMLDNPQAYLIILIIGLCFLILSIFLIFLLIPNYIKRMRKALLTEKEMKKDEEVTNKYMKEYLNTYKNPDTQIYGSVVKDKDNTENKEEIHFVQEKPDSTKIEIKEKKLSKEELKEEIKSIVQEVEEERDRKEQNKSNTDLEAQSKIKIDPKEPHLDMTNIKRGIKEVYGEKRFFMNDGIYISSLTQLVSILDNIEVEVFNRHVNDQKNDFYNWVYDTFQNKQLAAKIKDVRNKKEMSDVIKDYLLRE